MEPHESAWKRGRKDAVLAVKSFSFILLEVGGTAVIGIVSQNPWFVLYYFFGLLAAVFIGATISAPLRQRDDERLAHEETKKRFAKSHDDDTGVIHLLQKLIKNLPSNETPKDFTFIDVSLIEGTTILAAENISSVADLGLGDFRISFKHPLIGSRIIALPVGTTPKFEVVEASDEYVRVRFDQEPKAFKIQINGPIKVALIEPQSH